MTIGFYQWALARTEVEGLQLFVPLDNDTRVSLTAKVGLHTDTRESCDHRGNALGAVTPVVARACVPTARRNPGIEDGHVTRVWKAKSVSRATGLWHPRPQPCPFTG